MLAYDNGTMNDTMPHFSIYKDIILGIDYPGALKLKEKIQLLTDHSWSQESSKFFLRPILKYQWYSLSHVQICLKDTQLSYHISVTYPEIIYQIASL